MDLEGIILSETSQEKDKYVRYHLDVRKKPKRMNKTTHRFRYREPTRDYSQQGERRGKE